MTHTTDSKKQHRRWLYVLLIAASLLIFALLLTFVILQTTQAWDIAVMQSIHTWATPFLTNLMLLITDTGGVGRAVPLVLVAGWLLWRGYQLELWTLLGAVSVGQLFTYLFKWLVDRPRPLAFEALQALPTDASFPSGHALGSTILFGLLGIWLWQNGRRGWAITLFVWAALVGFSRVYLGVHHPTDVLASFALGTAWLTAVTIFYDTMKRKQNELSAHNH
ncbi:MAG: phosphatase PAP2 family protein [Ardenticatenaceae bacterium]|nr:phosphatase PAP2 family protein [Ardenticatenaceae bacterium]